jgi:hypothetical protein
MSGNDAKADQIEKHTIPGMPGTTLETVTPENLKQLNAHDLLEYKMQDVMNFAKQHGKLTLQDQLNPAVIKEGIAKANELINFYNKTVDSLGMTQGRMDWLEKQIKTNPQSVIQQLLGNNATLNEIRNSNLQRKQIYLRDTMGYTEANPNAEFSQTPQSRQAVPASVPSLNPQHQKLADWAHKNIGNDPRAAAVLKKLNLGQ